MAGDQTIPAAIGGAAEKQYSAAKTSVWWDVDSCQVPKGIDANKIAQNISSALMNMKYCGPVSITAYGDTNDIHTSVQQALNSTGISINHVPAGVKDDIVKTMFADMLFWAVDNPAPANYLLISGDRNFSSALHQLRLRKYNILLAQPPHGSVELVAAAKSVWHWTSFLCGGFPFATGALLQAANGSNILHPAASGDINNDAQLLNQTADLHSKGVSGYHKSRPALPGDATEEGNTSLTRNSNQTLAIKAISSDIQNMKNSANTTQSGNAPAIQFKKAPHEFFAVNEPAVPTPPAYTLFPRNSDLSRHNSSSDVSKEQLNQPTVQKVSNLHDKNKGYLLPPSDYIQARIGVVLLTLHDLKQEKLIPSEANIKDYIRHGDPKFRNIDVERALNDALEHNMIVKQNLGEVNLYVGRTEDLWRCVNTIGGHPDQYPQATWDKIQNFLSSPAGCSAMMASESRFEAGMILQKSCLKDLALGGVLQILNMILTVKKWIMHTQPGWQPISITIGEEETT